MENEYNDFKELSPNLIEKIAREYNEQLKQKSKKEDGATQVLNDDGNFVAPINNRENEEEREELEVQKKPNNSSWIILIVLFWLIKRCR